MFWLRTAEGLEPVDCEVVLLKRIDTFNASEVTCVDCNGTVYEYDMCETV